MTTINAFHPDYVKTHMPQFLTTLRKESKQTEDGKVSAAKPKVNRESVQAGARPIDTFPKTKKAKGRA